MKPPARRWALVLGIGLLVVVLGGGRWLALEVAERAWATTIPGGAAYIGERDFARLISGVLLLTAVTWAGLQLAPLMDRHALAPAPARPRSALRMLGPVLSIACGVAPALILRMLRLSG